LHVLLYLTSTKKTITVQDAGADHHDASAVSALSRQTPQLLLPLPNNEQPHNAPTPEPIAEATLAAALQSHMVGSHTHP
jgi:hypothetical protein